MLANAWAEVWAVFWTLLPLAFVFIGLLAGRGVEARHKKRLAHLEAEPGPVLTNLRSVPREGVEASELCIGSVVLASDAFKTFGAALKTMIGGRLRTLETVVDRARREALQRLRADARQRRADFVYNIRLETAVVRKGSVEVIAYGTAVRLTGPHHG